MANAFASALDELVACQSAEYGTACVATIGTMADVPCVIGANVFTDEIADGGIAQRGTQVLQVKKSLLTDYSDTVKFPNGEPPKFTPTIVRGQAMVVLDVDERDGIFYITTGDPSGSE